MLLSHPGADDIGRCSEQRPVTCETESACKACRNFQHFREKVGYGARWSVISNIGLEKKKRNLGSDILPYTHARNVQSPVEYFVLDENSGKSRGDTVFQLLRFVFVEMQPKDESDDVFVRYDMLVNNNSVCHTRNLIYFYNYTLRKVNKSISRTTNQKIWGCFIKNEEL